ncbi:MAG: phosphomannomutase/phosphoglucomutase [Kiritimatiellae bacterium]|nr:phosphomannomutase/phosphoglucomutase [Kiritimatiellia bacterium]
MGFFKAYDMRGTFGADFDLDTVYKVGLALPKVIKGKRWLVGRDCRTTSDAVHDALVKGLSEAGAEVSDLGLCTTPMVYYFTAADGFDGSVMITASHNPPTDNGLKVSKATALPVGYANGLNEVEKMVKEDAIHSSTPSLANSNPQTLKPSNTSSHLSRYIAWQKGRVNLDSLSDLKFAVDCSNGMSSIFAREMFPNAVLLNDTPDGTFPAHSPNPLKAEAREQIAKVVREKGLDCGVVFDGDADRAMFVDERGEFVQPDYLIPVVVRATMESSKPQAGKVKIIHDVRTSRGAIETLREDGFEPEMVPVGHAFAKPILRKIGALCGGELAGHYYFSEFFGCDSGLLAATRILVEIAKAKRAGKTFSEMMKPIVSRYANSGEINFKVDDKEAAIERVLVVAKSLGEETGRSEIDGYRLEYRDGWISVRKSNTEPYLRLLVECRTKEMLDNWVGRLSDAIAPHNPQSASI